MGTSLAGCAMPVHDLPYWLMAGLVPMAMLKGHRSHFGSRYKLGCCGHTGLFGAWFESSHAQVQEVCVRFFVFCLFVCVCRVSFSG